MTQTPHLLVCITNPARGYALISQGRTLADEQQLPLKVIAVLRHQNAAEMQTLYNLCAKFSAELTVLFRRNPAVTAAITAKQTGATGVLCDLPPIAGHDFVACLRELLPDAPLWILDETDTWLTFPPQTIKTAL